MADGMTDKESSLEQDEDITTLRADMPSTPPNPEEVQLQE